MGFNVTSLLLEKFTEELKKGYEKTYGGLNSNYKEIICWSANMSLDIISNSDALYHNVEHSLHVTLVGQEILRGKHIKEGGVSSEDWLHCIISLLCHDIGYVKGVCKQDNVEQGIFATGIGNETVHILPGSTDASLTPYHVDRGKLFVQERFAGHSLINASIIQKNIELTRFPVPIGEDPKDSSGFPGIVRAADLIGQLSEPRYLQKIAALYYEFVETGTATKLGYYCPGDLKSSYPKFYWKSVYPYIKNILPYLNTTQEGKFYLAGLYSNVFSIEHTEGSLIIGGSTATKTDDNNNNNNEHH